MASTFTAAFEEIAGLDFDLAVGYAKQRPAALPTPEEISRVWAGFPHRELARMAEQLTCIVKATCIHDAEEAIQDTFEILLHQKPEVFTDDPRTILGLVSAYARKRLLKVRGEGGPAMLSLDLAVDPKSEADPEREGMETIRELAPAVAYTKAGVDEEARFTPPPKPGEHWERLQAIGAVQRFRDETGRAPRSREFKPKYGLPALATVRSLGWQTYNDLLLEAGVPIEHPTRTRYRWTALEAAEACYRFRKREGFWPGHADSWRLPPGSLPAYETMKRYFGGATPMRVQLGCEAILGPIDIQPEPEVSSKAPPPTFSTSPSLNP